MLGRYWRLRGKWSGDQTLTYNNGARIDISMIPWKIVSGALSYGSEISTDLGFGSGDTIVNGGEDEQVTPVDNTSNLYLGIIGTIDMIADQNSTDGTYYLYLETSPDNTVWPSDQEDFDCDEDLRLLAILNFSSDAEDEGRATNFEF